MKHWLPLFFIFLLYIPDLDARTIHVPDQWMTIQGGINSARDGDTVLVQPGVYVEHIDFSGKDITVGSLTLTTGNSAYIDSTIIDASRGETVAIFGSGESEDALLCGFTLRNGFGVLGGGVFIRNSSPKLDHLKILDNETSGYGGGVYVDRSAEPEITNTVIRGNIGRGGGGIYSGEHSSVIFRSGTIDNNSCVWNGGGVMCRDTSRVIIKSSVISNNVSGIHGGGIYLWYECELFMEGGMIVSNECGEDYSERGGGIYGDRTVMNLKDVILLGNSGGMGGGIYCSRTQIDLRFCGLLENTTERFGGGMLVEFNSILKMNYVLFGLNSAGWKGGGIYLEQDDGENADVLITNTTFAFNSAGEDGGGFYISEGAEIALVNSILWADEPQEIYVPRTGSLNKLAVVNSMIEDGIEGIDPNYNLEIEWINENVRGEPRFIDPDNNDFNLAQGSGCIDAGTRFFIWGGDTIVNIPRADYLGNAPDIGRYESQFQDVKLYDPAFIPLSDKLKIYPNPFNSTATLSFDMVKPAETTLRLFNLNGQEVALIFNDSLPIGPHRLNYNAAGLAAGTYLVRMEVGDYKATRKVMLVK